MTAASKESEKKAITRVLLITGMDLESKAKLTYKEAQKAKRHALLVAHEMGHGHLYEHDVMLGIGAEWPGNNPDILRLILLNGIPIHMSAQAPQMQMQVS
jgi:hypothetical protein